MRYFTSIFIFLFSSISLYSQSNLLFDISEETAAQADQVCLDVSVQGFEHIVSMQYSIHYDPYSLLFLQPSNYNLPGLVASNFGTFPGILTFSWISNDLTNGTTLADGTVIFSLCFQVLADEGVSTLSFSEAPLMIEISNNMGDLINPVFQEGSVTINSSGGTDYTTLIAPIDTVMQGETFVVPITVRNFSNILSLQFGLEYDAEVLNFVEVGNMSLPYFDNSNVGTPPMLDEGKISVSWFDEELLGSSLEDGDTLFAITFEAVGAPGDMSGLLFSNNFVSIEIGDSSGVAIPYQIEQGSIYIFQEVNTSSLENPVFTYLPLSPNPMRNESVLRFELQQSSKVQWRVVGANGQVILEEEAFLPSGKHHIVLPRDQFPSAGTYLVELRSGRYRGTRTLIVGQ